MVQFLRFLALFPQYVDPLLEGLSMSLDEIASELGTKFVRFCAL